MNDGSIWLKVPPPKILGYLNVTDVCEALNINQLQLQTDFPVQLVQSVTKHILVPMRSRRGMSSLDPYFDLITELCKKYDADGFHLFSLDPMAGGAVHTRNFSPSVLMEEEAASASANAALVGYLHYHRILPIESEETIECEQGFVLGMKSRPSKVYVKLQLVTAASKFQAAVSSNGVTAQNQWLEGATGEETTKDRVLRRGDRYTSNYQDETRFNLPAGYYEEQNEKELEIRRQMEAAKRAGKEYKPELKEHVSTAILPPKLALPAEIRECWVGGPVVPSHREEYTVTY
eukprot:CAMPEP_0184307150 /NCGR_PEP_ID=MMETSP1049-20130417/15973_1 /TAXON_ID=77928 /ORGANISM="Proteomonas sulcata, Strain CCMP704" /LENGTH=289 /DNA_ID=CAMNT_0026619569 /DNA_START=149 /DNA_END=1018 /DNA_ORIENTATION=+